jgi:hypothetical protein
VLNKPKPDRFLPPETSNWQQAFKTSDASEALSRAATMLSQARVRLVIVKDCGALVYKQAPKWIFQKASEIRGARGMLAHELQDFTEFQIYTHETTYVPDTTDASVNTVHPKIATLICLRADQDEEFNKLIPRLEQLLMS